MFPWQRLILIGVTLIVWLGVFVLWLLLSVMLLVRFSPWRPLWMSMFDTDPDPPPYVQSDPRLGRFL